MTATRRIAPILGGLAAVAALLGAGPAPPAANPDGTTVVVTQPDETNFPEIAVYFEVKRADGSPVLDAKRDEFRVTEDGAARPIDAFEAPQTVEARPTSVVLVVDRSGSMGHENRIGGLKRAVARFLEGLPRGSRVAVVAFGEDVELIQPFTDRLDDARSAVDGLRPRGGTRFYDAVAEALDLLGREPGKRAVLALTDGADNLSDRADLDSTITRARRLGLPVHTLVLGTGDEVDPAMLGRLAAGTRGQAYSAANADQLRSIYEEIARRLGSTYRLTYRTDHHVPDGTLRPIQVFHSRAAQAGESAVFIPGMVAPAPGWPGLFLALVAGLVGLAVLPGRLARRPTGTGS